MASIAIIGAAGYLGIKLVDVLANHGHGITAVTRQNGEIMFGDKPVKLLYYDDLSKHAEKYDVIVNLAFATSTTKKLITQENLEILEIIKKLARKDSKILHTSTLAVFGFALDQEIKPEKVKNRADYPYIVSKLRMENDLLENFKDQQLSIIRLGNIWGAASVGWTVKLADNLLYEKPVVADGFGFSNITDVHNTADFIRFLAEEKATVNTFYHLAELGNISWEFWTNELANALGAKPVLTGKPIGYNKAIKEDIATLKHFLSPSPFLYGALETRFLSFYLRNFIASLPRAVKKPFNALPEINHVGNDFVFLTIMSCKNHFPNITHPNWKPPVNKAESLKRVLNWMQETGYFFHVKN
ncbi:MAG: NAD(P)-dependent oxidoreductase [Sphingobacteriales bacterium]|nr:MAG: NAD(P)-dependent oxidoreductase [Sphingobacteriales bacterium]